MKNTFGIDVIPDNDAERLEELYKYTDAADSQIELFDKLCKIVCKVYNIPIALISLVDEEVVYFKGNAGMESVKETSRGVSFCALAVLNDDITVVERPLEDPCVFGNPLVTGEFGLRFYAGAPLITPNGFRIGTFCIVDKKQRYITNDQKALLEEYATLVMAMLENYRTKFN